MCDIKRANVKRNALRLLLRGVALTLFTAWQLSYGSYLGSLAIGLGKLEHFNFNPGLGKPSWVKYI